MKKLVIILSRGAVVDATKAQTPTHFKVPLSCAWPKDVIRKLQLAADGSRCSASRASGSGNDNNKNW